MKKWLVLLLSLALLLPLAASAQEVVNVYNWEDYIDEADAVSASFDEYAAAHPDKLDLACVSLSVEAGSPFAGKTIGAVDFKGSFGCLVVAHEHEKLLKMKPSRNTRLFPDDRIWLVGETAAAQALPEKDGAA